MAALTQPKQDRWLCAHPRWDERAKAGTQRKNMATAKKCKTHSESCLPLFYTVMTVVYVGCGQRWNRSVFSG